MLVKVLCLLVFVSQCWAQEEEEEPMVIGALVYAEEEVDLRAALTIAGEEYHFVPSVKVVSKPGELLEINKYVCELAEEGVIGIIDGTGSRDSVHIQALCDSLELPHVLIQPVDLNTKNWSAINLHPSAAVYNSVIKTLITTKEWVNFTIIYEKGRSISRVQQLMELGNFTMRYRVSFREVDGDDYRSVLIDAKQCGFFNFVVDVHSKNIEKLLIQAQQVALMADEHSYIFVSPDIFTLDLSPYRYGGVNMTGFRLVPLKDVEAESYLNFVSKFTNETKQELSADDVKTKVILIYDAMFLFSEAKVRMSLKPEHVSRLDCESTESWVFGSSLLSIMRTNKVQGLTRSLIFDGFGERMDVKLDVLELVPAGTQSIATWVSNELIYDRPVLSTLPVSEDSIMRNKTFKVLIAETEPYGYRVQSSEHLEGNARYEGFTVDLIEKLSGLLHFNYEFEMEKKYGDIDEFGNWNGMVAQLIEGKADFALCDFTITEKRQSAIDFSTPFMTTGISILYKKPNKQPPEMFSFMAVFSPEVWYYMLFTQLGVGVVMIFVGRISYKEWQNPVPCIEQPEELSNQFSFANSVWLIIGSVMQQGSEIAPIALAPRMITSIWWFFTMVMVASYVGTLVAVLIVEKNVYPFTNVDELYNYKQASYGAKEGGSTLQFFNNSRYSQYRNMFKKMIANSWTVGDNNDGVKAAEDPNKYYAFFMESASIEYYTERHCDLEQIGKLLDTKSYGIGMQKGSKYKEYVDNALLLLKESGEIQKIKDLWWKEKRGGGKCGEGKDEEVKELGMKNMLGAFVVLGVGCVIGLFFSFLDMMWGIFKRSVKYSTSFKYELVEEVKFALKFSGDIKPVKRPSKDDEDEVELAADAEAEAKDELGSLRSCRTVPSARSTSTHHSSHSHSSRSHSRLSIAFAKRRQYS